MNKRIISIITVFLIGIIYIGLSSTPKSYAQIDNIENMIGKVLKEGDVIQSDNMYIAFCKEEFSSYDNWEVYAYLESDRELTIGSSTDFSMCSIDELDDLACYHDHSLLWPYIMNVSKYWVITNAFIDDYGADTIYLAPYEYKEPSFELSCNPNKIVSGEYSICTLNTKYYSKLKNLNFKLDIGNYEISDVELGESFDNLQLENGVYSVSGKDDMEENAEGLETTIIKFKVSSNDDKEITNTDNIKVTNLEYTDIIDNNSVELLTDTVTKEVDSNTIKNPYTGNDYLALIILIISLMGVGFYSYYRKTIK